MATRTQKAAMKKKAEAAKADKAHAKAHAKAQDKVAKPTPKAPAKKAKSTKTARAKPDTTVWDVPDGGASRPGPAKEGFWSRLGLGRRAKPAKPEPKGKPAEDTLKAIREQEKADAAAARAAERQAEADKLVAEREAAEVKRREADQARRDAQQKRRDEQAAKAEARREQQRQANEAAAAKKAGAKAKADEQAAQRRAAKLAQSLKPKGAAAPADEPVEANEADADHDDAPPTSAAESQADNVAAELMRMRSKPVTIVADDEPDVVPSLPTGIGRRGETPKEPLQLDPAPPAKMGEPAAPRGLSVPEHYLLLTLDEGWDERRERAKDGGLGGALAGALLLELVLTGKAKVQRDRFVLTDVEVDADAQKVVEKLTQIGLGRPSRQVMAALVKWLPQLLPAYKARMEGRGLVAHKAWRHLGLFYRSQTALLDADAQERLRNKLARAIAGGGRPDAPTILSLGLLEASGLFGLVVPEGAQAYNRKRLNGLLAGKDVMGYKVDDQLKGMQEIAVRTVLDNVRALTRFG